MKRIRFAMTGVLVLSALVSSAFAQSKKEAGQANIIVSTDLGNRDYQPSYLRAFLGTPRALHLRRLLGGRECSHPEHKRYQE